MPNCLCRFAGGRFSSSALLVLVFRPPNAALLRSFSGSNPSFTWLPPSLPPAGVKSEAFVPATLAPRRLANCPVPVSNVAEEIRDEAPPSPLAPRTDKPPPNAADPFCDWIPNGGYPFTSELDVTPEGLHKRAQKMKRTASGMDG